MKLSVILLITVFYLSYAIPLFNADNDTQKTLPEYIMSYGYSFEEHKVPTPDGYILTLWRIPKKITERHKRRQPVLMLHGLLDNGFTWLYKEGSMNLPLMLVNEGYDVWIGNNRGTLHSKEHMNPLEFKWSNPFNKYWDYSIDHMAGLDIPSMIDYICDRTAYDKIDYVGHSQGTAELFIQAMIDPEYINNHIRRYVALGAVFFVQNVSGLFEKLINKLRIPDIFYAVGLKSIGLLPTLTPFFSWIAKYFPRFIEIIVTIITGYTKRRNFDVARFPLLFLNEPGGSSTRNLLHWMQMMRGEEHTISKFDFGFAGNLEHYGYPQPPKYNVKALKSLKFPIYMFVGTKDAIVSSKDFEDLVKVLPKDGVKHEYVDDYGHLDYVWGNNAHFTIYPKIIEFLNQ
jgi:pimeloyl-ACP methyl ester carboxylesterase